MHFPFHTSAFAAHHSALPGMASIVHPHTPEYSCHTHAHGDPALSDAHKVERVAQPPEEENNMKSTSCAHAHSGEFSTPIRAPHAQHHHQLVNRESDDMPRTPTPPSPTASTASTVIGTGEDLSGTGILSPPSASSSSSSCSSSSSFTTPAHSPSSSSSCSASPSAPDSLSLEALAHRFTDLISYPLCQLLSDCTPALAESLLRQFDECIHGFESYAFSYPHLHKHTQTFIAQLSSKKKMIKDTLQDAGMHFPSPAATASTDPALSTPSPSDSTAAALSAAFPVLKSSPSARLLDDFRELRTLRSTLFGYLKLFEHRATGKKFAVKMSVKAAVEEESLAENPLNEVGFLRRVNDAVKADITAGAGELPRLHGSHFICKLMAEYDTPTHLISVLQFASGGDLFDYLDKQNRRPAAGAKAQSALKVCEARHFFIQLLQGVAFLHRLNICHLDLSLENLLLDDTSAATAADAADFSSKRLFICDFGAARSIPRASEQDQEQAFPLLRNNRPGKLATMSHEVFTGKDFRGTLSDAYSCGVLFFMLLTSVPPYEFPNFGDKRFSLIFSGQLKRLVDAWKMNDRVPAEAMEIVGKLICPEERRWSVEQVLKHPWIQEGIKEMTA